jgi:hypothetical protein
MGVKFNREGFVLMGPDGTLKQDSLVSAHSKKRVVPTGVLVAVPDTPGLFYRITHGESTKLNKTQHKALHKKAQEWLASLTEPDPPKGRRSAKKTSEPAPTGDVEAEADPTPSGASQPES